jgi:hypothetical protein
VLAEAEDSLSALRSELCVKWARALAARRAQLERLEQQRAGRSVTPSPANVLAGRVAVAHAATAGFTGDAAGGSGDSGAGSSAGTGVGATAVPLRSLADSSALWDEIVCDGGGAFFNDLSGFDAPAVAAGSGETVTAGASPRSGTDGDTTGNRKRVVAASTLAEEFWGAGSLYGGEVFFLRRQAEGIASDNDWLLTLLERVCECSFALLI